MTDTIGTADDLMRSLLMERTPTERMRMCARMFSSAKVLARAGITAHAGALDDAELRGAIFLRFYGREFSERQRQTIIEGIHA